MESLTLKKADQSPTKYLLDSSSGLGLTTYKEDMYIIRDSGLQALRLYDKIMK